MSFSLSDVLEEVDRLVPAGEPAFSETFKFAFAKTFSSLGELERQALLTQGVLRQYENGQVVVEEGEENRGLYIVVTGEIMVARDIRTDQGTTRLDIAQLGEGTLVGEMSFLDQDRASATVVSIGRSKLLHLPGEQIDALCANLAGFDAHFYRAIAILLSRRLRAMNTRLGESESRAGDTVETGE